MADRDIPQIGVDIYTPDFQVIAKGFGCRALRAESDAQLRDGLREAIKARGPTVIEIDDAAIRGWA
jgi:acetolactate synthase-1/2/3 large subunit